jgi:hypothetical protein
MEAAAGAAIAKAATASSGIKTAADLADTVSRIKKDIEPYASALRDLKIDYLNRTARLTVYVHAPSKISRSVHKIQIRLDGDLKLREVRTSLFERVPLTGTMEGRRFVTKASELPPDCEDFLFMFEGQMSEDALRSMVDVRASADPMVDGGSDVYWLLSTITHPEILEQLYEAVEIDKVNIAVHVALQRHFFTSLPPTVYRVLQAREELFRGVQTGDRSRTRKAEYTIRRSSRQQLFSESNLMAAIAELLSQSTLREHVSATNPYQVDEVDADERRTSLIPERFKVQAGTTLNLSTKIARGSLRFERDAYKGEVSKRIGRLISIPKDEKPESGGSVNASG